MSPTSEASAFDPASVEAVVIGASAGGIEALNRLLPDLPADFGAAMFVVVHMRADVPSLLPELFASRCRLAVAEPNDKDAIEPGTVYVAPPGYHMLVEPDRTIALSIDPPVRFSRPSVDVLFESAAYAYKSALLGIVLSGANDDGARGALAIREAGGHCWVQDPATAGASAMPQAAIANGAANQIMTLDDMAALLSASVGRARPGANR
ncbi:chemotaxis protein CheB [Caballeronia telluris]|jgi:two-component system chemotaxis response regulator CheB|uniref:protein-glutamate methylesterase n=1 Tax=Caballeronia telluris TaxID=326475 RepID=A0A158ETS0_9BURK|nr:chemotaxis protein CheB [Caballeronia telluris]SAL10935.1 chemotaxis-specific methylesterase [Caballeronia telluris]